MKLLNTIWFLVVVVMSFDSCVTHNRVDLLQEIVEHKHGEVKAIIPDLLDARARISFLEAELVRSQRDINRAFEVQNKLNTAIVGKLVK